MAGRLDGRIAFVTGAASGIGAACAQRFVDEGATVAGFDLQAPPVGHRLAGCWELDVRDGAWNLRVNRVVQYIFLNYHHHRAHHQHPDVPWIHLGKFVDFTAPRPSFASIYLSMWKGPRPLPREH